MKRVLAGIGGGLILCAFAGILVAANGDRSPMMALAMGLGIVVAVMAAIGGAWLLIYATIGGAAP